jgi:hypothetical protein
MRGKTVVTYEERTISTELALFADDNPARFFSARSDVFISP